MTKRVAVYTESPDLAGRLRAVCEGWEVVDGDGRERCRIALLDGELQRPPGKSVVRVVLVGGDPGVPRGHGELRVDREAFLRAPADYLGFAADAADAVLDAARREQETLYLRHIQELMTMVDAESVSERITKTLLEITGQPAGALLLHDPRLERFVVSYSNDPDFHDSEELVPGIPPDLLQRAISSPDLFAVGSDGSGGGLVAMPLRVQDDLLGVVRVPLGSEEAFGEEVSAALSRYLGTVTQVVSNVYQLTRSRDLAMRDDLTKAYNRRFFETYLDEEIERSRRYGTLISIIFLDLDDLKSVNNRYGHLSGSRTLQEVAKRILSAVRGIDKVVRFGGDEFCVILPQTDEEQAVAVANRIARAIAASTIHLDGTVEVSITASFGIATYPTHAIQKEGLIRQADAAMYRVKSTTKNAVGVAGEG